MAYRAMKRWPQALAASDTALRFAYGPRKLLLFSTRVGIYADTGDSTSAKHTLAESLRYAEALPSGQRTDRTIADLRKKLAGYR